MIEASIHRSFLFSLCCLVSLLGLAQAPSAVPLDVESVLAKADSLRKNGAVIETQDLLVQLIAYESSMSPWQRGRLLKLQADVATRQLRFEDAIALYKTARASLWKSERTEARSMFHALGGSVANALYSSGKSRAALDTLLAAEERARRAGPEGQDLLDFSPRLLTLLYQEFGEYDAAYRAGLRSIATLKSNGDTLSRRLGFTYNNLGTVLQELQDSRGANEQYTKAYHALRKIYPEEHRYVQSVVGNIATTFSDLGEPDRAIPLYARKLELLEADPSSNTDALVNTYMNLIRVYRHLGEYERALKTGYRAVSMWRSVVTAPHWKEGNMFKEIAKVQRALGRHDEALSSLNKAGDIYLAISDTLGRTYLEYLFEVGLTYRNLQQPEQAFPYFQKAYTLTLSTDSLFRYRRPATSIAYAEALLQNGTYEAAAAVLDQLSSGLQRMRDSLNPQVAQAARSSIQLGQAKLELAQDPSGFLSDAHMDTLRAMVTRQYNRLHAIRGRANRRLYAGHHYKVDGTLSLLVESSLRQAVHEPTRQDALYRQALSFIEAQQVYLRREITDEGLRSLAEPIRDSISAIQRRISSYEQQIFRQKTVDGESILQRSVFRDSIASLERRLAVLYPQTQGPLLSTTLGLEELDDDQAALVLYETAGYLNVLTCTAGGVSATRHALTPELLDDLKLFRDFTVQPALGVRESGHALQAGQRLYELIFADLRGLSDPPSQVGIVTASARWSIPFAALPVRIPAEKMRSFREIFFAVGEYTFSNHTTLQAFTSSLTADRWTAGNAWFGFAPISPTDDSVQQNALLQVDELPFAYAEVQAIAQSRHGQYVGGADATLQQLESAATKHDILHLATHASSNVNNPDFSYIVVADEKSGLPVRAYGRSLAKLSLPISLMILSACESGEGVASRGEGTVSLASLFLEAGVRSIVNTSWRIEDKRGAELSRLFYERADQGLGLDLALAEAQRTYLASSNGQYGHPFYWAAFQISGHLAPPRSLWHWLGLPLALLGLGIVVWFVRH